MCEQCLTNPISFGEPMPGFFLKRARRDGNDWKQGEWGLIECNDPSYRWCTTPTPDSTWGMTDDEEEAWFENADKSSPEYRRAIEVLSDSENDFYAAFKVCSPLSGYDLVKAAIEVGYDPERSGSFQYWFFDYLGEWLKTAEITEDGDAFPEREEYAPSDLTIGKE
jgi:hypothetical protein